MAKDLSRTINIAVPAVLIVATIALLLVFMPEEPGALFWFNFCFIILLEGLFSWYFVGAKQESENISTPMTAMLGTSMLAYIGVCVAVMLIYSLALRELLDIRFYIAALIIITVIWFVPVLLTLRHDNAEKADADITKGRRDNLHFFTEKAKMLAQRYNKACAAQGIKAEQSPVDVIVGKVVGLTPNVFRNEMACMQLQSTLDKCEAIVAKMESGENAEQAAQEMQTFASNAVNEIMMLKNLARR